MNARLVLANALAAALLLTACGGSSDGSDATPATTPSVQTSPVVVPDVAELRGMANELIDAIKASDRDRIRDMASGNQDTEADALAACVREGQEVDILVEEVFISGDEASVEVLWHVTGSGRSDVGQRTWQYERQGDGSWALSELPECPIASQE